MKIVWDEPKRLANLDKHVLDFADLTAEFFLDAVVLPARDGRSKAVGRLGGLGGRVVTVIFSLLGDEAVSVISLRPAAANERKAAR